MADTTTPLPPPPENLSAGEVELRFDGIVPGDPSRQFVPYYHFRIMSADGSDVGYINFRVGDTDHVRLIAGHIGFEVHESFRGHGYARQACNAIAPLVRTVYETVLITCNPDNFASRRTIERLGAVFINEVAVPPHELAFQRGIRSKLRYAWTP
jgi:tagatose 1,6-diphosphate aldolase